MKKKKLANLLLKNYILLYFVMMLIFAISFVIFISFGCVYWEDFDSSPYTASNMMKNDFKKINATNLLNLNGYIEVIDKDFKIIYRKGNSNNTLTKYTKEEYYKMLINNEEYTSNENFVYSFAYNSKKEFLLLTAVPKEIFSDLFYTKNPMFTPNKVLKIVISFYIISLILGIIIYSRLTSKSFVIPLKKLMNEVHKISNGDYSARITLKTNNEFGELSDAFNSMAEKIQEEKKLKEKSENNRRSLILDISHDLKNPLASVIGYSDFLIKNPTLSTQERSKYLNVIENNAKRANDLIIDLFEFSKLNSTDFNLELKKEDICEFMRELIASYIPLLEEHSINYYFDIPENSILVSFDSKNLDRAISNLILNSIKYNPSGTTLNITIKQLKNSVEIILQDTGIGIPKNLCKDIFEPFVRVDSSRNSKTGGTGLGLSITKTIIEKHNGKISIDTDSNCGCTFTIVLNQSSNT